MSVRQTLPFVTKSAPTIMAPIPAVATLATTSIPMAMTVLVCLHVHTHTLHVSNAHATVKIYSHALLNNNLEDDDEPWVRIPEKT